jgi:hypothetical protein
LRLVCEHQIDAGLKAVHGSGACLQLTQVHPH